MNIPNEHWQNTEDAFHRAQRNYDAQMPEEFWDCEEQGHRWKRLPGESKDGTCFARCIKCGLEKEI